LNPRALRRTYPLGIFRDNDALAIIGREKYSSTYRLVFGHGRGLNFTLRSDSPSIVLPLGRKQGLHNIDNVRISQVLSRRILTYSADTETGTEVRVALHENDEGMDVWDVPSINRHLKGSGMVVPEYLHDGQYVIYFGQTDVRVAFSRNLVAWHTSSTALAKPRSGMFDRHSLKIVSVAFIDQGLLVIYETQETKRDRTTVLIGGMLCSRTDPEVVLWRSNEPLGSYETKSKNHPRTLGAAIYQETIQVYLSTDSDKLVTIECPNPYAAPVRPKKGVKLHRFIDNPILSPTAFEWESRAVFNPAAFTSNGRVHLLYRAMGEDGVSRIGYASSADGIHFDERLEHPVYNPVAGFGAPSPDRDETQAHYDPELHPSGGGWAGCEDPRAVTIDGRVYMSFVAFDGWDFVRQAITSITEQDFHAKNWAWRKPVLISKPGEIQKNWVLFPEKINGKYAILHGLSPNIQIEYVKSLDQLNGKKFISSLPQAWGAGYAGRKGHWDNRVRGAGSPPIKTPMGWLLLYHATDSRDPAKYKLGAMLLDLNDPTKVKFRTNAPLLEPEEWYENDGKPGVIYTCGAVIVGHNLVVYYGGGDKHIAVARANVEALLEGIAKDEPIKLDPVAIAI
jgi:predicted GH43/DUF377 family glycosyl hydrolase